MPTIHESKKLSLYLESADDLAARFEKTGERASLVVVDAPYSDRTHKGHDEYADQNDRRQISFASWSEDDVARFVDRWAPLTSCWLFSITDHVLWPAWQRRAEQAGLYAGFIPLPLVVPGSRVRRSGDGPSPWSYWGMVARTKSASTWGTLDGYYQCPREKLAMAGGKPLRLMEQIVEDYSRPGDLVVDPCCGAGTSLVAALRLDRLAAGSDIAHKPISRAESRCLEELRRAA